MKVQTLSWQSLADSPKKREERGISVADGAPSVIISASTTGEIHPELRT